jgi:hypothetical protein
MDLVQVIANAFAGAFGMGVANEMYHAFREYRTILKQRLLDETVKAVALYRKMKAEERFRNVARTASIPRSPMRNPVASLIVDDLPRRTPVILEPVASPWRIRPKREAQLFNYEPPQKLTYSLPDRPPMDLLDWD